MPIIRLAGASLALALASVPLLVGAQAPAPRPADVASPEAIVAATYASIAREPGGPYDWDRFLSLFLEGAHLIPNVEQTGGQFVIWSPEDFKNLASANTNVGGPNDRGFAESGVKNIVERYGDVAHVFSTYEKHWGDGDTTVIGRGINSFQMRFHDGRWWITGIIWDEPTGAGPIPERYLP
jgi:hypothetical protein